MESITAAKKKWMQHIMLLDGENAQAEDPGAHFAAYRLCNIHSNSHFLWQDL